MDLGIRGELALVTASSGGTGRNIAYALAAEGANIVLFARTAGITGSAITVQRGMISSLF
jgi:NAD(P)-dependent dehydrogenase (short-subunit alcohol dehydrogenase family)